MALSSAGFRAQTGLVIALLTPAYAIVWLLVSKLQELAAPVGSWMATSVLILALVTASAHFVLGFMWARWVVGLLSLVFAGSQLTPLFQVWSGSIAGVSMLQLVLLAVAVIVVVNAVWLLGSATAKGFFEARRATMTPRGNKILRVLRWSLVCVLLVGVAIDLQRLLEYCCDRSGEVVGETPLGSRQTLAEGELALRGSASEAARGRRVLQVVLSRPNSLRSGAAREAWSCLRGPSRGRKPRASLHGRIVHGVSDGRQRMQASGAAPLGFDGPPFRWDEDRRFLIRAELDAAFFHLYLPSDANGDWVPARKADAVRTTRRRRNSRTEGELPEAAGCGRLHHGYVSDREAEG